MAQILEIRPTSARIELVDTDLLSRHAESQIRARSDAELVAEYAHAMLGGAEFPPIMLFDDGKTLHLADGHHRVDAAALASTKNRKRPRKIRAEIRPGTFEDALRWAMRANATHGKRLDAEDHKRAIKIALENNLIEVKRASDVVPALVELIPGLSAQWAAKNTTKYRSELTEKRNRLIAALHAEGKTQDQIAKALDIPQTTVTSIISRINEKTPRREIVKPPPAAPDLPEPYLPPPPDPEEKKQEVAPPAKQVNLQREPAIRLDFKSYLPLLDRFELPETSDDDETGIVIALPEPEPQDDPRALEALDQIDAALRQLTETLTDLSALTGRSPEGRRRATINTIIPVMKFLTDLAQYLGK